MKSRSRALCIALVVVAAQFAAAQGTISVSPAALSLRGRPGQTSTQHFRISNLSSLPYAFKVDITDVVVENGERKFIVAGKIGGGIASRAFAPSEQLVVAAGQDAVVPVTFVLPPEPVVRAVAVFFRGAPVDAPNHGPRIQLNIGAVVDFSITDRVLINASQPQIALPNSAQNLLITESLSNVGYEPFIARGMAAILGDGGKIVAKAAFSSKRLLPSERNALTAEYPGTLQPGKYRALCSVEYSGKTITRETEFIVP